MVVVCTPRRHCPRTNKLHQHQSLRVDTSCEFTARMHIIGARGIRHQQRRGEDNSNYPCSSSNTKTQYTGIAHDDPAVAIYEERRGQILEVLQSAVPSYHAFCLYNSNHGPALVIDVVSDQVSQERIPRTVDNQLNVYFDERIPDKTEKEFPRSLSAAQRQIQPGIAIGLGSDKCRTGTLGCIISDREQDFVLTVCKMTWVEAEKVKSDRLDVVSEGTKHVVHPAHYDVVLTKNISRIAPHVTRTLEMENRFIAKEAEKLQEKLAQVKRNKKIGHLMYETTGFGGELVAEEDIRCCQVDYSLIS
jgi:hypothetical protein